MYEKIDTDNEDASLRPSAHTEIPLVARSDLSANRFDEYRAFRPKPIDLVTCPFEHGRKFRSPVVAYLPQRISRDSGFCQFSEKLSPDSSLDLDRIATRDIDSTLAHVQLIACERRQEPTPIFEVE